MLVIEKNFWNSRPRICKIYSNSSGVDSRGVGDARAPPEFGGSLKGQSLISACQSLAITASTSGFEKISTVLNSERSEQLLVTECFFNLFLEVSHI